MPYQKSQSFIKFKYPEKKKEKKKNRKFFIKSFTPTHDIIDRWYYIVSYVYNIYNGCNIKWKIHLIFESMAKDRRKEEFVFEKEKRIFVDWSDDKIQARKKTRGLMERGEGGGGMNERESNYGRINLSREWRTD